MLQSRLLQSGFELTLHARKDLILTPCSDPIRCLKASSVYTIIPNAMTQYVFR